MNIYCEGAKAAEIIFSLTGGREGRIMSYAPPVKIFIGIFKVVTLWGGLYLNPGYKDGVFFYGVHYDGTDRPEVGVFYSSPYPGTVNFVYVRGSNPGGEPIYLYQMPYEQYVSVAFGEPFSFRVDEKKGLLIQDSEGILYAHDIPDGFNLNYQVNCIGCNPGECAGSDGKGSVICMDCKQMSKDMKAIKKSLGR